MAGNKKYKVTADLKRNRLIITIPSTATQDDVQKIYTDIRFCVADLKPCFDIITDYSHCIFAHLSAIPTMRQIMDYLVSKQPGNVIRVMGETGLLSTQLLRFTDRFQSYTPVYVSTHEEAEAHLTDLIKRNGLRFQIRGHQVEYTIDQETGNGELVDISISGCKVQGLTRVITSEMESTIIIPVSQDYDLPASFTLAAKIVRAQDDMFAAEFLDLDDEQKALLHKWFTYEVGKDKSQEES